MCTFVYRNAIRNSFPTIVLFSFHIVGTILPEQYVRQYACKRQKQFKLGGMKSMSFSIIRRYFHGRTFYSQSRFKGTTILYTNVGKQSIRRMSYSYFRFRLRYDDTTQLDPTYYVRTYSLGTFLKESVTASNIVTYFDPRALPSARSSVGRSRVNF